MVPKKPIKSFRVPKTCICKNAKHKRCFNVFEGARPSKTDSEGPAPKGSQDASENLQKLKKGIQTWIRGLPTIGIIWGAFWGLCWGRGRLKKRNKNRTMFGTLLLRLIGVQVKLQREINESDGKVLELEIYSPKERER